MTHVDVSSRPRRLSRVGAIRRLGACVLAVAVILLAPHPASADTSPPAGTPATVSADGLPTWQVDGVVWDSVVVGNTVYVTGSFTAARPPGVAPGGAGQVAAGNVFAFDLTTGNRVSSFNHSLNAQGLNIVASPDGSRVYVVGDFTAVDGKPRGHVAAFDTATNALDTAFAPSVSAKVATVTASNATVWIGGNFFKANGQPRTRLAAFRSSDGVLLPWAPTADDLQVVSMVLAPGGSRVVVGGKFRTLNGQSAPGMGSLDAVTGALQPWAINTLIRNNGDASAITSLSTNGTLVFGSGYAFGSGNFEGTFAADPATGKPVVVNDCHGDTYDTWPVGTVLYSVSHAHDCRWMGGFPESSPRSVNMRHALAFTTYGVGVGTGPDSYGWNYAGLPVSALLPWYPTLTIGSYTGQSQAAWTVSGSTDYIVLGGEFPSVNGAAQQGLVRFAVRSKAPNRRGPVRAPQAPTPTAQALGAGSVRVTWQSAYDMDNAALTYTIYRSGTVAPVYSTTARSSFWLYPSLSFLDSGVPAGRYSYTVKVSDPLGNTLTLPATAQVTVP